MGGLFCNLANPLAVQMLIDLGFKGAIVSPELDKSACLSLPQQSPLPLGIIASGNWPLCLSRIVSDQLKIDQAFISPRRKRLGLPNTMILTGLSQLANRSDITPAVTPQGGLYPPGSYD